MKRYARRDYERRLNEAGIPFDERKSNGGRIPDRVNYGTWIRKNEPIAFDAGYQERRRDIECVDQQTVNIISYLFGEMPAGSDGNSQD